jgi:hypothetical protein
MPINPQYKVTTNFTLLFTALTFGFCHFSFGQSNMKYVNPTGTYHLVSKTKKKDGDVYGWFGTIQVKTLTENKIAMTFYICKGAPGYNSGSFVDTLLYQDNKAVYADEDTVNKKCVTTFVFSTKGVAVSENANYDFGTCWGHGVAAFGHFRKKSSKVPVLTEPLTGEKL